MVSKLVSVSILALGVLAEKVLYEISLIEFIKNSQFLVFELCSVDL